MVGEKRAEGAGGDAPAGEKAAGDPEPITQQVRFKPAFMERYQRLLGDEYEEFIRFSTAYIKKCLRVNTLKISVRALVERLEREWILTPVPWCGEAFWIEKRGSPRYDLGNLPEHQLGYYYLQEAASLLPPVILQPRPGETILDLCAAPGSKASQIAQYMRNEGVLIANDVQFSRLKALGLNLQRCGVMNAAITLRANKRFREESFDRVLVDAPCSGTGTIRRSLKTMEMWSPGFVKRMASEQQRLLLLAYNLLKPGGRLVYSTCTLEPEENEGVVSRLLEREPSASILEISLPIKRSPSITSWEGRDYHPLVKRALRIHPQDNDTEGFFIALITKR